MGDSEATKKSKKMVPSPPENVIKHAAPILNKLKKSFFLFFWYLVMKLQQFLWYRIIQPFFLNFLYLWPSLHLESYALWGLKKRFDGLIRNIPDFLYWYWYLFVLVSVWNFSIGNSMYKYPCIGIGITQILVSV